MILLSAFFILNIIYSLYYVIKEKRFSINITPFLRLLTLLCLILLISSIFSPFKITAFKTYLYFLLPISSILITSILSPELNNNLDKKHIFYSGLFPAIFTLILFFIKGKESFVLFFGNQNWFSSYLVLCLVFYFFIEKKDFFTNLTSLIYISIILLSGSRTAFLSTFLLLLLNVFLNADKKMKKRYLMFSLVIIFLFSLFVNFNGFRYGSLLYRVYNLFISTRLLSSVKTLLLGTGLGTYSSVAGNLQAQLFLEGSIPDFFNQTRTVITHAHNEFAEIAVEGGIFSLICVFFLFFYLIRSSLNKRSNLHMSFFIIFIIISLFSFPFHLAPHILLFYFVVTNLLSKETSERKFRLSFIHTKKIRIMLIIILILSLIRFSVLPFVSSIITSKTVLNINPLEENRLFQYRLKQAYKLSFFDPEPLVQLMWSKALVNDNKKTINIYKDKLSMMKEDSNIFLSLAYINIDNREFDKAEDNLFKSILFSRDFIKPAIIGRDMYLKADKPLKAADFLKECYVFLRKSEFLIQAGHLYFLLKHSDDAIDVYKKLIENKRLIDEDNKESFLKIANFRLFQLTGKNIYLNKAKEYKVQTSIDKELEEAR